MKIPRRWLARLMVAGVIPIAAGALAMASASASADPCAHPNNQTSICVQVISGQPDRVVPVNGRVRQRH